MYLNGSSCYLVGPIEHDKNFGKDWREVVSLPLSNMGVKILNPLDRPKWMLHIEEYVPPSKSRNTILNDIKSKCEKTEKSQSFIRDICLRYVNTCDFVFCYLSDSKTYGTIEELSVASDAKKPIIIICPNEIPSLWIYDMIKNDYIFENLNESLNFLHCIDKGFEELDALKWIFLQNYPKLKLEKKYDW